MAAITSKAVHELVQQLDREAVATNKEEQEDLEDANCQAALLLDSLGIENWVHIFYTFTTKGEEQALAVIRQLHEDLPAMLENDTIEEGRAEKLATLIGKALSWTDLEKSTDPDPASVDNTQIDVSAQVRSNPLINFEFFSEEEKAEYSEYVDNFSTTQAEDNAARTDLVQRRNMAREFGN
ncbi:hypothetical protein R1sor_001113 [Riccia sorocarpa]|uniref:Uncharacterized protein n=1 Tax=Riccia sorocarpa TaxID=122646 RepID=A0ABD3GWQ3_9MARC